MGYETEIEFFLRREREERAAASGASCLAVHDAHFVMAERYADQASSLFERDHDQEDASMAGAEGMKVRVNARNVTSRSRLSPVMIRTGE